MQNPASLWVSKEIPVEWLPLPEISLSILKVHKPAKNYFSVLRNNLTFIEIIKKEKSNILYYPKQS